MPIEAKFHVEAPWDGGMKVSTIDLCHMTKMATMSIYGKNLLWNENADDLETFIQHRVLKHNQICFQMKTLG